MILQETLCSQETWTGPDGQIVYPLAIVHKGAVLGINTVIGSHCFIECGAIIGKNVTVKNGCMIWEGVTIGDGCFIGPGVIFTNDRRPKSPRAFPERYKDKHWLERTWVGDYASIGAGCLIAPGVKIEPWAKIPIGTIVLEDWKFKE